MKESNEIVLREMQTNLYNYNRTIFNDYKEGEPIDYTCDGGSGLMSITWYMEEDQVKEYNVDTSTLSKALKSEVRMLKLHIEEMHRHYKALVIEVDYCKDEYDYDIECPTRLIKEFKKAIKKLDEEDIK